MPLRSRLLLSYKLAGLRGFWKPRAGRDRAAARARIPMGALLAPFMGFSRLAMLRRVPGWAAASSPAAAKAAGAKDGSGLGQERTRWLPSPFSFRSSFTRFFFLSAKLRAAKFGSPAEKAALPLAGATAARPRPPDLIHFVPRGVRPEVRLLKGKRGVAPALHEASMGLRLLRPPPLRGAWAEPGKY